MPGTLRPCLLIHLVSIIRFRLIEIFESVKRKMFYCEPYLSLIYHMPGKDEAKSRNGKTMALEVRDNPQLVQLDETQQRNGNTR